MELPQYFILAQVVGAIALIVGLCVAQMKKRSNMLVLNCISNVAGALQYLLLGAWTGLALSLVCIVRSLLFRRYAHVERPQWPFYLIVTIITGTGLLTWTGPLSLVIMLGVYISTYEYWQRSEQRIRKYNLLNESLQFAYDLLSFSIVSAFSDLLNVGSTLVGLWRFRKTKVLISDLSPEPLLVESGENSYNS